MTGSMQDLLESHRVVVCTGAGGVGKTTTAAVMALSAARAGRRAVVVTIDPAKRLADALGIGELGDTAREIDGDWSGELWALMLDTESTFDSLVRRYAAGPDQAQAILSNRFYRNIAGALSGTQEYMAMEKLHELHAEARYDLIVVDTPPTRNALDFIDAPERLTRLLDNRLFRLVMAPTRAYMKAVNVAAQTFLKTIGRVVGSDVVRDTIAFFQAFDGMEEGFRQRAQSVLDLMRSDDAAFVLVTAPRADTVREARFFADRLTDADIVVRAVVANRLHPGFGSSHPGADRERARTLAGTPLGALYENLSQFRTIAERERDSLDPLVADLADAVVVLVPFLDDDVHDVAGLDRIAHHLLADPAATTA